MIEVKVETIQVSLMSEHRVVILKELNAKRYLPIWIGPYEAEAIAIRLKGLEIGRPLTHDLLSNVINALGGEVQHILVNALRNDTFYARITVNIEGRQMEIDSRPSDAVALAVRVDAPIFVAEEVMEEAGIVPEEDISEEAPEDTSAFRDFIDNLDLDDLPIQ